MTTPLRQRWLLAVLVAGQFMANVDIAIVNVATPSIHRDLHASGGALEFVVSGYVLAFAMLIITGARLGRIAGYQRVYLAGLAGFTLASLVCSLAPGTGPDQGGVQERECGLGQRGDAVAAVPAPGLAVVADGGRAVRLQLLAGSTDADLQAGQPG